MNESVAAAQVHLLMFVRQHSCTGSSGQERAAAIPNNHAAVDRLAGWLLWRPRSEKRPLPQLRQLFGAGFRCLLPASR